MKVKLTAQEKMEALSDKIIFNQMVNRLKKKGAIISIEIPNNDKQRNQTTNYQQPAAGSY